MRKINHARVESTTYERRKGSCKIDQKNRTDYSCPICSHELPNKSRLLRHLLDHVSARTTPEVMCNSCDGKFSTKGELLKHLKSRHPGLFRCTNNARETVKRVRRKNAPHDYEEILVDDGRKLGRDGVKRFKEVSECPYCKTPFSMKNNLLKHMKIIHKVTDLEKMVYEEQKPKIGHRCAECEKVFSLRKNLYQHLRKIHGRTDVGRKSSNANESIRLICDACGVGFGEKKSLTRHLRIKHAVKVGKEKKTVAVCVHCNSTFAHRKSLYKHERKFHGADYKKIVRAKSDDLKKFKDNKVKKLGKIEDYPRLKEILPERSDYKLTQFAWLKEDNHENWFKAKLYFTCETKEDVRKWKENYEMLNKLCLRVLSFPRPRTPGVLYKGRFRCHHNTMPKKGAKPNAKHTACSAVLSITLLQPQQPKESSSNAFMKAYVFLKNTHNHALGDPATLKYRKPIREVKEKFLKLFEAKKTVPQALAIHKADLEMEYGPDRFQSIVNDRAFMPDARWAYGLYYSSYKKKREEISRIEDVPLPERVSDHSDDYVHSASILPLQTVQPAIPAQSMPPSQQDPYQMLSDIFRNVCREIIDRCDSSPNYFYPGLQTFIAMYQRNCNSDAQLLAALQSFGECCMNATNCRERISFQPRNVVGLPGIDFNQENVANTSAVLHAFPKYSNVPVESKPRIAQTRNSVVQSTTLVSERDILGTTNAAALTVPETHGCIESRTLYALDTGKYEDGSIYQIDNRQSVSATNCWVPAEYGMY